MATVDSLPGSFSFAKALGIFTAVASADLGTFVTLEGTVCVNTWNIACFNVKLSVTPLQA